MPTINTTDKSGSENFLSSVLMILAFVGGIILTGTWYNTKNQKASQTQEETAVAGESDIREDIRETTESTESAPKSKDSMSEMFKDLEETTESMDQNTGDE